MQDPVLAASRAVLCVSDGSQDRHQLGAALGADVDLDRIAEVEHPSAAILSLDGSLGPCVRGQGQQQCSDHPCTPCTASMAACIWSSEGRAYHRSVVCGSVCRMSRCAIWIGAPLLSTDDAKKPRRLYMVRRLPR